jgi:hypothetical protein
LSTSGWGIISSGDDTKALKPGCCIQRHPRDKDRMDIRIDTNYSQGRTQKYVSFNFLETDIYMLEEELTRTVPAMYAVRSNKMHEYICSFDYSCYS